MKLCITVLSHEVSIRPLKMVAIVLFARDTAKPAKKFTSKAFIAQRLKSSSHRVCLSGGQPLHAAAISMAVSSFRHGDWQRRRDTSAGTVTRDLELAAQFSEPDSAS
jgi:hypothetical protein